MITAYFQACNRIRAAGWEDQRREVSVVWDHFFSENVSTECEHVKGIAVLCVFSGTLFISVTCKNNLIFLAILSAYSEAEKAETTHKLTLSSLWLMIWV